MLRIGTPQFSPQIRCVDDCTDQFGLAKKSNHLPKRRPFVVPTLTNATSWSGGVSSIPWAWVVLIQVSGACVGMISLRLNAIKEPPTTTRSHPKSGMIVIVDTAWLGIPGNRISSRYATHQSLFPLFWGRVLITAHNASLYANQSRLIYPQPRPQSLSQAK